MKFRLLTALWGAEFCELFFKTTARSLLATGNFPDIARRHAVVYSIFTTQADSELISRHPVFQSLSAAGTVELKILGVGEFDPTNPSSHWTIWRKGIEDAKKNGECVIYIMPDVFYASGTLVDWVGAFEKGYRAVFTSVPEVVLETTLQELERRPAVNVQPELNLTVRELTDLLLTHIHPYHLCMLRGSRRWIVHPEFVGYVAGSVGFVQRIMGSHPFCFDPNYFEFNQSYIPLDKLDKIAFLPPTAVSLEPLLKFMNLYYRSWEMTEDRLSSFAWWFNNFASKANDIESAHSYVFPIAGNISRSAMRRLHAQGDIYRSQALAARTIFRVWAKLTELGCDRAAAIVATAHYAGRLRRSRLFEFPLTVLVPNNAALGLDGRQSTNQSALERRKELVLRVYDHCFPGNHALKAGERIVTTASGEIRESKSSFGKVPGSGRILSGPFTHDGITFYVTDFVAAARSPRHDKSRILRKERKGQSGRDQPFADASNRMLIHPSLLGDEKPEFVGQTPLPQLASKAVADFSPHARELEQIVSGYVNATPTWLLKPMSENTTGSATKKSEILRQMVRRSVGPRGQVSGARKVVWVLIDGFRRVSRPSIPSMMGKTRELLLSGRFDDAVVAARNTVEVWRRLGGDFIAQGNFELGIYCRKAALELHPDNLQLRLELVREFFIADRKEEAKSVDGGLIQLWRLLGGDFVAQGLSDSVIFCRRRALELGLGSIQLRMELVRELLMANRIDEANAEAGGLRQLWRDLGNELADQGHSQLAQYCRDRTTEVTLFELKDPILSQFRKIQIEIGLLALREILKDYVTEIGEVVHAEEVSTPLGFLDDFISSSKSAWNPARQLTELLEREPDFSEAWLEKAFCHWEARQAIPALTAALRASQTRPRCSRSDQNLHPHAEAAALVARILESAGLFVGAIDAYRKSLALDEGQIFLRVSAGQLLWKTGYAEEAMKEFSQSMTHGYRLANLPDLPRRLEKLSLSLNAQ